MNDADQDRQTSYQLLRKEVEETFGKKISSSRDCIELADQVLSKISYNLSSNTLRRFFGLVKSNYQPSSTTLEILSKFCEFDSFDQFILLKRNRTQESSNPDYYSESILDFFISIFKSTPAKAEDDKTFSSVVWNTIIFLERHPELCDSFQRAIAKTRTGQHYYFEQYINIDKLNSHYGNGLRFYLKEKNTVPGQIFGHALLCLKNWLSDNDAGVKRHHDEVE